MRLRRVAARAGVVAPRRCKHVDHAERRRGERSDSVTPEILAERVRHRARMLASMGDVTDEEVRPRGSGVTPSPSEILRVLVLSRDKSYWRSFPLLTSHPRCHSLVATAKIRQRAEEPGARAEQEWV